VRPPSAATLRRSVERWNAEHGEVTPVRYWTGTREGPGLEGETWTLAKILGGHTAGVYIRGAGFVALSHVEVAS
jgi:hypothetical protein